MKSRREIEADLERIQTETALYSYNFDEVRKHPLYKELLEDDWNIAHLLDILRDGNSSWQLFFLIRELSPIDIKFPTRYGKIRETIIESFEIFQNQNDIF